MQTRRVKIADLREEVVEHVRANVVVDLVKDAIIPVNRAEAPAQIAPLLHNQPRVQGCSSDCKAQVLTLCSRALGTARFQKTLSNTEWRMLKSSDTCLQVCDNSLNKRERA